MVRNRNFLDVFGMITLCSVALASCKESGPAVGDVYSLESAEFGYLAEIVRAPRIATRDFNTDFTVAELAAKYGAPAFDTEISHGGPEFLMWKQLSGRHGDVVNTLVEDRNLLTKVSISDNGNGNNKFSGGARYIGGFMQTFSYRVEYSSDLDRGESFENVVNLLSYDLGMPISITEPPGSNEGNAVVSIPHSGGGGAASISIDTLRCSDPAHSLLSSSNMNRNENYTKNICRIDVRYKNASEVEIEAAAAQYDVLERAYAARFGQPDCWLHEEKCLSREEIIAINKEISERLNLL